MIAKQTKGRGFRGTLNYLLKKEGAEIVGGNMLGETPQELATEFAESRKLRPGVSRAVYHASLSLPIGEHLSNEKWAGIAGQYVERMGFEKSQYVAVRHTDTEHDHIHIVASRIGMDGRVVSESNDYKRSEEIIRGLEIEHGLTRVTPSREVEKRAPTRGELELSEKGIVSTKLQLQGLIDAAVSRQPTMGEFIERMDAAGVGVIPNVAHTGHVSGVSFVLGDEQMKGSDLGRGYTWAGLQKRGVDYDEERDSEAISRCSEYAKTREPERDDRDAQPGGLEESRSSDGPDRDLGGIDGEDDGLDESDDGGPPDDGEDDYEGSGNRDGEGEVGGREDRGPGREADPQNLGPDVSYGVPYVHHRGYELRALAGVLRATTGGGDLLERARGTDPGLESGQAKRVLQALGLGSEEVEERESESIPRDGFGGRLEHRKGANKKDPFSLEIGREREIEPHEQEHSRSDDGGLDFDF